MNNRPIKFRAWNKKNKCWVANGDSMDLYHSARSNGFVFDNDSYDLNGDIEFVQWTGLLDKNGKEIYEGDVLKTDSGSHVYVSYRDDMQMFVARFSEKSASVSLEKAWEVIGNIYENPNLIKN